MPFFVTTVILPLFAFVGTVAVIVVDDLTLNVAFKLPTMTLFQWRALGRPVHGIKKVS